LATSSAAPFLVKRAEEPEACLLGGLSFGYFSLAKQRKVTRRVAKHESKKEQKSKN